MMRNLSPKIKLLIAGAIAVVALLLIIAIAQLVNIHQKNKRNRELNLQLENTIDQIAGSRPPAITSVTIQKGNIIAELKL